MSESDGRRDPSWLVYLFALRTIACLFGPLMLGSLAGPWTGAVACLVACFVNYWRLDRRGPPGWRLSFLPGPRNLLLYLVNGLVFALCLVGIARDWVKP